MGHQEQSCLLSDRRGGRDRPDYGTAERGQTPPENVSYSESNGA